MVVFLFGATVFGKDKSLRFYLFILQPEQTSYMLIRKIKRAMYFAQIKARRRADHAVGLELRG